MKQFKRALGFTLIELLIVVAIIGVLAAVGIPMYQGYIHSAKYNAAKENHSRIHGMIAAAMTKCAGSPTATVTLKRSASATTSVACSSNTRTFVTSFVNHFRNDNFLNPYTNRDAVASGGSRPAEGITNLQSSGSNINVFTNIGKEEKGKGRDKILQASIVKE